MAPCHDCGMRAVDYCFRCAAAVCARCRSDYHGMRPRPGCAAMAGRRLADAVAREHATIHGKGGGDPVREGE